MPSWWKFLVTVETSILFFSITSKASVVDIGCLYIRLVNPTTSQILNALESEAGEDVRMKSTEQDLIELRVFLKLFDLRDFLESIGVADIVNKLAFDQLAESLSIELAVIFFKMFVERRQFYCELV